MEIEKVAALARLKLSESEKKQFEEQMSSILSYFEELKDVKTDGVVPLVTPGSIKKDFRKDEAVVWENSSLALEMAPQKKGNLFQVPPVV